MQTFFAVVEGLKTKYSKHYDLADALCWLYKQVAVLQDVRSYCSAASVDADLRGLEGIFETHLKRVGGSMDVFIGAHPKIDDIARAFHEHHSQKTRASGKGRKGVASSYDYLIDLQDRHAVARKAGVAMSDALYEEAYCGLVRIWNSCSTVGIATR